jgi:hypothetical protein
MSPDNIDKLDRIFRWAVQGLQLISEPGTRGAQQIHANSNPFLEWLEQHVVVDPDGEEPRGEVFIHFDRWLRQNGHKSMGSNKFANLMRNRGFGMKYARHGGRNGPRERVWVGLRLRR